MIARLCFEWDERTATTIVCSQSYNSNYPVAWIIEQQISTFRQYSVGRTGTFRVPALRLSRETLGSMRASKVADKLAITDIQVDTGSFMTAPEWSFEAFASNPSKTKKTRPGWSQIITASRRSRTA